MSPPEPNASRVRRTPPHRPSHPVVALSPLETRLFHLLRSVADSVHPQPTLRVAGGWVRDKLLDPCSVSEHVDIDIALDTMLGIHFAERINRYLDEHHMPHASVGLIQKNPDQSKHLETATMRVMDVCLDLVNLRTETYSHDSRIPNIRIGTPYEDAMRRDLTINALFYNINTRSVEDFTHRGMDDIRDRIIRTPLPPLTTLLDDPLRALRAIRFASRLNFSFDAPLFDACRNSRVHDALGAKVSRERISHEIDRVVACDNAPHAIGLLVELGLFPIVFRLPPQRNILNDAHAPSDFPTLALGALLNLHTMKPPDNCAAPRKVVRYAALLSPLATVKCSHVQFGKKRKNVPVAQYILRHELRLGAKDVTEVCALHAAALNLQKLVHNDSDKLDRLQTGRVIRAAGPFWRSALQIALVMELRPAKAENTFAAGMGEPSDQMGKDCRMLVDTYRSFGDKVESMGLEGVWNIKPIIDGNDLLKLLPRLKKGPLVGTIMKEQIDWMVKHPNEGTAEISDRILHQYKQYR
ncbi:CCA tRNA nucleotidyltransferase, mitochondrial [Gracilariopsis chorda]|uniref:CCA tRNA nucleotidyltransferase, mitochondrial n=1 Tax=Gracilariopsis chorda TaxID=448386 RepID=A0A2V3IIM2_9FLOR|nr:CCA tRNA nucleotidyltransferase, mitochondrial [Gracilariopsis chorda]|eukprot:PXF41921.1 CCA tRNA nucleotidyltransferase, mitochondrial [Gracilariopsis chorda]